MVIGDRQLGRDDLPFPLDRSINGQDLLNLINRLIQPLWSQAAGSCWGFIGTVAATKNGTPKLITVTLASGETFDAWYDTKITVVKGVTTVYGMRSSTAAIAIGSLA